MFSRVRPGSFLEEIDPTVRQRHLGHIPVFWAWRAQIFEGNASCAKAVSLIQAWARANGLSGPSGDTGGYCQARCRIGSEFLVGVQARILRHLGAAVRPSDLWRGHVLKAIDGSSVQLADTTANQRAYPQPLGQKSGCGFPTMGIVGVLNLCLGGWDGFETCPHTAHGARLGRRPALLKHVGEGDILLGDRAFCSFELIALLRDKGAHAVMRLHQARHAKLDWRRGKKLSAIERLVVWKRQRLQPAGSTMDARSWAALPEELVLRYIKLGYVDRCETKRMLVVVTTLLDGVKYDALDVVTLYARRWDIELKRRDVKRPPPAWSAMTCARRKWQPARCG